MQTMTIWNGTDRRERFVSYHAEAVHVEPGTKPVVLGIFYAHVRSRAEPTMPEVNTWSLSGGAHYYLCSVGMKYPSPLLLIKVIGVSTYDEYMSRLWAKLHSKIDCY